MSESKRWRDEGNNLYQKAGMPGLSPMLVISRLTESLNAYFRAEQAAVNPDEKASAQKNYSKASWWLANAQYQRKDSVQLVHTSIKNGFLYYNRAAKYGVDKPEAWRQNMKSSMEHWFDFSCQYYISETSGMRRGQLFEELASILLDGKEKGQCYLSMCQSLYFRGVEVLQSGDFRMGLSLTKDCYFPLEEASRLLKDKESISEINILREDIFLLTCMSESHQARHTGDTLLEKLLMEEEDLNMSLVYSVLDWYKNAVILTREKEIEFEAAALSRIGRVYAKVLKMKYRAKEYFRKCIELGLTLFPRSPEQEEWFKEAKAYIKACQEEEEEKERSKWENVRKQYIDALKPDIKKLDDLARKGDDEELVRHIYKTHPPKNKKHVVLDSKSPWDKATCKKAIMKALTHYHPDKIDMEEHGAKWKVMCEEITKIFNNRFMCYKGVD